MDKQFVIKPSDNEKDMRRATTGPNTPMTSEHEARAQLSGRRSVVADHRTNNGFGGNNLEHLANEERGRFDNIDLEQSNKNDYSLLANFSKN